MKAAQQRLFGLFAGMTLFFALLYLYPLELSAPSRTATETATATEAKPASKGVAFAVLDSGADAPGAKSRKNYAVYTQADLADFWKIAHGDRVKVPTVDFKKQYVIVVFGGRTNTERSISVAKVEDVGTARNVSVMITEGCGTKETSPFEFISVPMGSETSLSHTDETKKASC